MNEKNINDINLENNYLMFATYPKLSYQLKVDGNINPYQFIIPTQWNSMQDCSLYSYSEKKSLKLNYFVLNYGPSYTNEMTFLVYIPFNISGLIITKLDGIHISVPASCQYENSSHLGLNFYSWIKDVDDSNLSLMVMVLKLDDTQSRNNIPIWIILLSIFIGLGSLVILDQIIR
ncbi:hypothetical protein MXB_2611, partial [Myxobolus squamalis]